MDFLIWFLADTKRLASKYGPWGIFDSVRHFLSLKGDLFCFLVLWDW